MSPAFCHRPTISSSSKLNLKLHLSEVLGLRPTALGCQAQMETTPSAHVQGQSVCAPVCPCVRECVWMAQFIWNTSQGALGCQVLFQQISLWEPKRGWKLLPLMLLWLYLLPVKLFQYQSQAPVLLWTDIVWNRPCGVGFKRRLLIIRDAPAKPPSAWHF